MNYGEGIRFDNDNVNVDLAWSRGFSKSNIKSGKQYAGLKNGAVPKGGITQKAFLNTNDYIKKAGTVTSTTDEFASGTTYSTTSGSLPIFPVWVMPGEVDIVLLEHPFYAMMPKRAVRGKFIDWNQKTARGSASFKYEDPAMEPTKDTRTRQSIEIKRAYSIRRLSNFSIAVNNGWQDEVSMGINSATEALLDLLEQAMISGDASTNAYEFSGLDILISTNTEDQSGAELSIDKIEEGTRWASQGAKSSIVGTGKPNMYLTNNVDYDKVKALLRPYLRYNDTNALSWGITSYIVNGIPVVKSPFANITAGSRRWYILDMRKWWMGVLQDITFQELPVDGDARKFMLKAYLALTCEDENKNAMLYGIGA